MNRRVRALFYQDTSGELKAPILGPRVLEKMKDWGMVAEWPGLEPAWIQGGPRPDPDLPGPPSASWVTAFEEEGPVVLSLKFPPFLPLVPDRLDLSLKETIWAITEGDSGRASWAMGLGRLKGAEMLSWDGFWSGGGTETPDGFWRARKAIPHSVIRHARSNYLPFDVWNPIQTLTGALGSIRYNRVEGGSLALPMRASLSSTVQVHGWTRISTSSYQPTGGLGASWEYWPTTLGFDIYRKLEDANRWEPAERKKGNSLMAFLTGRDDGQYYTAEGGSLWMERAHGLNTWRVEVFGETDRAARFRVDYSVFPRDSILEGPALEAEDGDYFGVRAAIEHQRGILMEDGILVSSFWITATGGDRDYLKAGGILDALIGRGWWAIGARAGAGWVSGDAPLQREYFLGGTTSIRGYPPATLVGSSMALGRLELAVGPSIARVVGFGDIGWAGSEERMPRKSTLGIGVSLMEGLIRLDFAKPLDQGYGMKFYLSGGGLL